MTPDTKHTQRPTHEPWDFSARCFTEEWDCSWAAAKSHTVVNAYPLAQELRKWLMGESATLSLITPDSSVTNPFTQHASYLVSIFSEVVNDYADLIRKDNRSKFSRPIDVDIKRMRMASEMILYVVRICEALFKQLLFCTQFETRRYQRAALGGLLSSRCEACWKEKGVRHMVSFVGSLFHRYEQCGQYEQCLRMDLRYLNQLRNQQAAHATVGDTRISPSLDEAWRVAEWYCMEIGNKFTHMLEHIAEIERVMLAEMSKRLLTEKRDGKYNSNLVSTYYWERALSDLYGHLRRRAATVAARPHQGR